MRDYRGTALVLGAGGFIGSHMVKRLRKEGYWVRGVDLKSPEFSKTDANEFIHGDLRDTYFVKRILGFKGEQGNFYNSVPERYIEPFDYIHDNQMGFAEGNVVKYITRWRYKENGIEDLYKAKQYIDMLIAKEITDEQRN